MSKKLRLATMDYTKEFIKWSLWYIPIFALVYIILNVFLREPELNEVSFFSMALSANRIYMLVLGILAAFTFLEWSISLGLTRRIFLYGMTLGGVITSLFITAVTAAISFLFGLMPWFGTSIPEVSGGTETLVYVGGFFISTLLYFLGGFLISAGFYRGVIPGMGMVLLVVILNILLEMLINFGMDFMWFWKNSPDYGSNIFTTTGLPIMAAISIVVIGITYAVLYFTVRNIPVKIK